MSRRRLSALVLIVAAGIVAAAVDPAGETLVFGGAPKALRLGERWTTHVLRNPGFTIGYSEWRRQPLWVAYRAGPVPERRIARRPEHFSVDTRVLARVTSQHYNRSGYTRGHLAPNYLIGKLYGVEAQRATFLMSNIAPQRARLNALAWQRLEEAEADVVAPAAGDFWVVTGPLFTDDPPRLRSGIAVPAAFYRIWLDPEPTLRALAFIVPQDVCGTEPLSRFLASVDEVERRAGLDFFRAVDDVLENAIEASVATTGWRLPRFDRSRPRYADRFADRPCTPPDVQRP